MLFSPLQRAILCRHRRLKNDDAIYRRLNNEDAIFRRLDNNDAVYRRLDNDDPIYETYKAAYLVNKTWNLI